MSTMLDVAKKAKVALSTVSYAINGTRPISNETRQRIYAVMEELDYHPNALARGLASRRSHIIALLFPNSERGLGITELEFVTSAADAARENGYNLVLWPAEIHDSSELRQFTQQGLVDGVVVMEVRQNDERINLLRDIHFPFSMIGRCADTTGLGFVDIDFEKTIQDVVAYLSSLGHTHIAFLNQSQSLFNAGYGPVFRSQASFEDTIQAQKLFGISRFCRAGSQNGYDTFNEILAECPEVTALISLNERATPGVMRSLVERKWRLPDDFSLVGAVSSARLAEMMVPTLTTADAPSAELARLSVEQLIEQLETGEMEDFHIQIPCKLSVRGSTGPNLR